MQDMAQSIWRNQNIGRLMNEAVRIFERRVIELMHEKGFSDLSAAHVNLTRHLDETGNRQTELAERAAMTKQSMGELIVQVERAGLVKRQPDPADGRAKLVVFTPKGLAWLDAFGESVQTAEKELRAIVGADATDLVRQSLARYISASLSKKG